MVTLIKRFLGYLGFTYCKDCGRKLEEKQRGYYDVYYLCPHCDHLERFDMSDVLPKKDIDDAVKELKKHRVGSLDRMDARDDFLRPVTKEAKEHMDEVNRTKGRPKEECEYCGNEYKGLRGLKIHQARCAVRNFTLLDRAYYNKAGVDRIVKDEGAFIPVSNYPLDFARFAYNGEVGMIGDVRIILDERTNNND